MPVFYAISVFVLLLFLICLFRAVRAKAKQPALIQHNLAAEASRSNRYAEILSEMIRHETISQYPERSLDKFYQFHDLLEKLFPIFHKNTVKMDFDGSLLFRWKGGAADPALFMSHFDVVEASGEWRYPPFSGKIENGVLWGRGTQDTKGSLFCILQAVEELMQSGFVPAGDLYVASACNEETGGAGSRATVDFLKKQGVRLAFLIDEGGCVQPNPVDGVTGTFAMIGVLEKGYGDLKFTAKGRGGHSSIQSKNTPLARLAKFISDAENKDPFTPHWNSTVAEMYSRMTPYATLSKRFFLANAWLFKPLFPALLAKRNPKIRAMIQTTLSFTMAKGSDGYNVIPNMAYVTGNLRFSPDQDMDESVSIMQKLAEKYEITTEVVQATRAIKTVSYSSGAFSLVERVLKEIYPGSVVTPYAMTGATDAGYFVEICDNALRFAPIVCNQKQMSGVHSYDENISIDTLAPAVDFYKRLLEVSKQQNGWS